MRGAAGGHFNFGSTYKRGFATARSSERCDGNRSIDVTIVPQGTDILDRGNVTGTGTVWGFAMACGKGSHVGAVDTVQGRGAAGRTGATVPCGMEGELYCSCFQVAHGGLPQ